MEMIARPRLEMMSPRCRVSMMKLVYRSVSIFFMVVHPFVHAMSDCALFASQFAPGQFKKDIFESWYTHLQVGKRDTVSISIGKQGDKRGLHCVGIDDVALVGLTHSGDAFKFFDVTLCCPAIQPTSKGCLRAQPANQPG